MRNKIVVGAVVAALLMIGTLGYFQYTTSQSRMPDWISVQEGPVSHGVEKFYRSLYVKGNLTTAGDLTVAGTADIGAGCEMAKVITFTTMIVTQTTTLANTTATYVTATHLTVTDTHVLGNLSVAGTTNLANATAAYITATHLTVTDTNFLADLTLVNGETIGNDTDGVVDITTDDFVVGNGHDFTGSPSTIAGGDTNTMYSQFSFIGGGYSNVITGTTLNDDARYSVLVGGNANQINSTGDELALVGGYDNLINGAIDYSFLGGGYSNEISGTANSAVLVGGGENSVGGSWASVLGGYENDASGAYATALGRRAHAASAGTFVWGDSTDADVTDIGANTFNVRATNGMYVKGPAYLETGYAAKTASYTALITETGKIFSNQGATAEITITLPSAAVGYNYCVYVFAAYTVTVQPASADQIHHLTDAATNRIQNVGTVGDNVCLQAADNTYWLPLPAEHGTWSDVN